MGTKISKSYKLMGPKGRKLLQSHRWVLMMPTQGRCPISWRRHVGHVILQATQQPQRCRNVYCVIMSTAVLGPGKEQGGRMLPYPSVTFSSPFS